MTDTKPILVTEAQACKALSLSRGTLINMRKNGTLPFVLLNGRTIRYRMADLERVVAKNTIGK